MQAKVVSMGKSKETYLLFIETGGWMFPVTATAFEVAQSPMKKLKRDIGSLVVSWQGNVRRIQSIKRVGFWGNTWGDKFKSALFGVWEIRVEFGEPFAMSLEEFKDKVLAFLACDFERGAPQWEVGERLEVTKGQIAKAQNFEEVFRVIDFPPLEDCLDVL